MEKPDIIVGTPARILSHVKDKVCTQTVSFWTGGHSPFLFFLCPDAALEEFTGDSGDRRGRLALLLRLRGRPQELAEVGGCGLYLLFPCWSLLLEGRPHFRSLPIEGQAREREFAVIYFIFW